jgi:hypothetical protein
MHAAISDDETDASTQNSAQAIAALKDTLASTVDAFMLCQASQTSSAGLSKELNDSFTQIDPKLDTEGAAYGANLAASATRPQSNPELIAIDLSFSIVSTNDHLFLLYEHRANTWQKKII